MTRLLRAQLKKSYGKNFENQKFSKEFEEFIELVEMAYTDFEKDRFLLERTLEVNSQELSESNKEILIQHNLLKNVSNSVSDFIFYKNLDFKYIGCNKNFESLTGLKESDIINKDDYEIFEKEYADLFREMDIQMLSSSQKQTNKEWVRFSNGEMVYMSTLKSPLFDIKGEKIGLVGVSRDITKEYELQQELEKKNALIIHQSRFASMGEMISNIAHQWRQPLNALSLLLQNIEFIYDMGSLNKEYITQTIQKGNRLTNTMSSTIDDFRNFFKPNSVSKAFNIAKVLENTVEMLSSSCASHNIELVKNIDSSLHVLGSPNEFSQVLLNILNNAKDALITNKMKNRKIFIDIYENQTLVYIDIADNAGGIEESILEKVFDPYFTTKAEGKGTGIGLYMSKTIIENNMNGLLEVENIPEGVKFTIKLKRRNDAMRD